MRRRTVEFFAETSLGVPWILRCVVDPLGVEIISASRDSLRLSASVWTEMFHVSDERLVAFKAEARERASEQDYMEANR